MSCDDSNSPVIKSVAVPSSNKDGCTNKWACSRVSVGEIGSNYKSRLYCRGVKRQKDIVWEIKKISNLVWGCLKGTIQEKTTKEKSTLKKYYNDNYNLFCKLHQL